MLSTLALFLLSIAVLLISTQAFVKLAVRLSLALRISPLVIGTTVVAIGTSFPELIVSGLASSRGDNGLALGNIIGSNIVNVFLVLPVAILFGRLRIGTTKTQRNVLSLLIITTAFSLLYALSLPARLRGVILILFAFLFTLGEFYWGVVGRGHEDSKQFRHRRSGHIGLIQGLVLLLSLGGIWLGGTTTVSAVKYLSEISGYSTTILGLSLTAVATSLPEFFATIFGERSHQEKMVIGTIIGSNLYNLLLIGGVSALLSTSIKTVPSLAASPWLFFFLATGSLVWLVLHFKGSTVPKWVAVLFLLLAALYLSSLTRVS